MLFSHGWGRILTVMSPQGTSAIIESVQPGDGIRLVCREGALPQFHEIGADALERLVQDYEITVLNRDEWQRRKEELGPAIYE